jgi:ABC-2 type transport system permease protein
MNLRHELKLLWRDPQVPWVIAFIFLVISVAFWSGAKDQADLHRKASEAQSLVKKQSQEQLDVLKRAEQGETITASPNPIFPGVLAYFTNPYILKSEAPLSITAVGESDVRPSLVRLGDPMDPTWTHDEISSPLALATGRFDLVFASVTLLPLAVIALMFRLYSSEKETGMLPLLQSGHSNVWSLLLGRTLLRFLLVVAATALAFFLGVLFTLGSIPLGPALNWIAAVTAYLAFWFAAAFYINTLERPSGWNLVALISAWLALVILLPTGFNAAFTSRIPSPSRLEALLAYRAVREHEEPEAAQVEEFLAQNGIERTEENSFAAGYLAKEYLALKEVRPQMELISKAAQSRDEAMNLAGVFNPAVALNQHLVRIAGKDASSFRAFEKHLSTEESKRSAHFLPMTLKGQKMTPRDFDQIPSLGEQVPPDSPRIVDAWPLAVWILILIGASRQETGKS